MGLGPAVCTKCLKLAEFVETGIADNGLSSFGYWRCTQCQGSYDTENRTLNNLFCIPKEEWSKIDQNSGTNFCKMLDGV